MRKLLSLAVLAALGGCANNGPIDPNRGELIASPGVQAIFDDEDVDIAEATDRVRCERIMRVGTHLIERYCYTVPEQDEEERRIDRITFKAIDQIARPKMSEPLTGRPRGAFSSPPD